MPIRIPEDITYRDRHIREVYADELRKLLTLTTSSQPVLDFAGSGHPTSYIHSRYFFPWRGSYNNRAPAPCRLLNDTRNTGMLVTFRDQPVARRFNGSGSLPSYMLWHDPGSDDQIDFNNFMLGDVAVMESLRNRGWYVGNTRPEVHRKFEWRFMTQSAIESDPHLYGLPPLDQGLPVVGRSWFERTNGIYGVRPNPVRGRRVIPLPLP